MQTSPESILKSKHFKVTLPRQAILRVFIATDRPMSAEDVMSKIEKDKINDVTVYRTLQSFEKKGILRQIDLRTGKVLYELNEHHHHHIVCKKCGTLEDFEMCIIEKISEQVLEKSKRFQTINDHSFELFGICKSCIKKC